MSDAPTYDTLLRFAQRVVAEHRNDGQPGDVDGAWLEALAVECGFLVPVTVTAPCSEECACAELDDFPQQCLRLHSTFQTDHKEAP